MDFIVRVTRARSIPNKQHTGVGVEEEIELGRLSSRPSFGAEV